MVKTKRKKTIALTAEQMTVAAQIVDEPFENAHKFTTRQTHLVGARNFGKFFADHEIVYKDKQGTRHPRFVYDPLLTILLDDERTRHAIGMYKVGMAMVLRHSTTMTYLMGVSAMNKRRGGLPFGKFKGMADVFRATTSTMNNLALNDRSAIRHKVAFNALDVAFILGSDTLNVYVPADLQRKLTSSAIFGSFAVLGDPQSISIVGCTESM